MYRSYIESPRKERGQSMNVEVEVIGVELQKKLTQLGLVSRYCRKNFVKTELQQGTLKAFKCEPNIFPMRRELEVISSAGCGL